MNTLVGQTVIHSLKTGNGDYRERKLLILKEFTECDKRMYLVRQLATRKEFHACADTYDRLFLVVRTPWVKQTTFKGDSIQHKLKVN